MTDVTAEPSLYEVQVAATKIAAGYNHGFQHLHHLLMALAEQDDFVSRVLVGAGLTRAALKEQVLAPVRPTWALP